MMAEGRIYRFNRFAETASAPLMSATRACKTKQNLSSIRSHQSCEANIAHDDRT